MDFVFLHSKFGIWKLFSAIALTYLFILVCWWIYLQNYMLWHHAWHWCIYPFYRPNYESKLFNHDRQLTLTYVKKRLRSSLRKFYDRFGDLIKPLTNVKWHSVAWPYTMTTLHRSEFMPIRDLITELDLLPNYERFSYGICDGRDMPTGNAYYLRTPGPITFGTCICSIYWDKSFSRCCRYFSGLCTSNISRYFLDFVLRILCVLLLNLRYCGWLNFRRVPIFVVFVEGPIHESTTHEITIFCLNCEGKCYVHQWMCDVYSIHENWYSQK